MRSHCGSTFAPPVALRSCRPATPAACVFADWITTPQASPSPAKATTNFRRHTPAADQRFDKTITILGVRKTPSNPAVTTPRPGAAAPGVRGLYRDRLPRVEALERHIQAGSKRKRRPGSLGESKESG